MCVWRRVCVCGMRGVWCVCGRVRVGCCQGREREDSAIRSDLYKQQDQRRKGVYQKRSHGEYGPTQEAKLEAKARCEARIKSEARDQPMRNKMAARKKQRDGERASDLFAVAAGRKRETGTSRSLSDLGQMVRAGEMAQQTPSCSRYRQWAVEEGAE